MGEPGDSRGGCDCWYEPVFSGQCDHKAPPRVLQKPSPFGALHTACRNLVCNQSILSCAHSFASSLLICQLRDRVVAISSRSWSSDAYRLSVAVLAEYIGQTLADSGGTLADVHHGTGGELSAWAARPVGELLTQYAQRTGHARGVPALAIVGPRPIPHHATHHASAATHGPGRIAAQQPPCLPG